MVHPISVEMVPEEVRSRLVPPTPVISGSEAGYETDRLPLLSKAPLSPEEANTLTP